MNYASLPGILPKLIIQQAFHQPLDEAWLRAMTKEQSYYSKSNKGKDKVLVH